MPSDAVLAEALLLAFPHRLGRAGTWTVCSHNNTDSKGFTASIALYSLDAEGLQLCVSVCFGVAPIYVPQTARRLLQLLLILLASTAYEDDERL